MSCTSESESSSDLYRESFKYFKNYEVHSQSSLSPSCSVVKHSNRTNPNRKNKKSRKKLQNSHVQGDINLNGENDDDDSDNDKAKSFKGGHYEDLLLKQPGDEDNHLKGFVIDRRINFDSECKCYEMWGLRSPETWTIKELTFPAGLIVIRNPFTPQGQRYWMSRTLLDFPHHPQYITNLDNLNRVEKKKRGESVNNLEDFKLDLCSRDFYEKLRWVTFGYHHDWDTKVYTEERRSKFPKDLADMTRYMSQLLGFQAFEAEAAIANYYHMDSTLSGHVDRSEVNQCAPLFSMSFGQTAIFLIGGKTKLEKPQPVLLQSGDIAVMSGESRASYHGVPKILTAFDEPWIMPSATNDLKSQLDTLHKRQKLDVDFDKETNVHNCLTFKATLKAPDVSNKVETSCWTTFLSNYISKSRINLNIRQVLFPGQIALDCN